MKRILIALTILTIGSSKLQASDALHEGSQFGIGVSASFGYPGYFYSALFPYGEWIELEPGFHVWRPLHVRHGWRPYLYGRWVWTDYGWYWVSTEPFGWAVFHYGRWYYDDYYGWVWVPDDTWGPAWVEWRYNDDYIGWSPLPPYASFSISIGIRFTTRWAAPSHYWCFVRYRHFSSPYVVREVVPVEYTRRLIGTTRSAGRYEVDGDRVINRGVDRNFVERRGYRRVERVEVAETRNQSERVVRGAGRERVEVYRPSRTELERAPERIEATRASRGTTLDLTKIERRRGKSRTRERQDEGVERRSEGMERRSEGTERRNDQGAIRQRSEERRVEQREPTPSRREEPQVQREERRRSIFPPRDTYERRESERKQIERSEGTRLWSRPTPERREIYQHRSSREERKAVAPAPRQRVEAPRFTPERRESGESPRGSEHGRSRDRKRDGV